MTVEKSIGLKDLAKHLGLSPTTLSLVLNDSPAGASIPPETRERIFAAARGFNYKPNYLARSLRAQRSYTIGVLVPELSEGYSASVLSGIESFLITRGYVYIVASHRHNPNLLGHLPRFLCERRVDGLIGVDTAYEGGAGVPAVCVSGSSGRANGVRRVVLNHEHAADLALRHLRDLGHTKIAFIKGQEFSADTHIRWDCIRKSAREMGLRISRNLVAQLSADNPLSETGYLATQELLASGEPFSALFAFNDISAIGAMRALHRAGKRVPEDVSIVGFDNIPSGAYQTPALTTVGQPLQKMGSLAAEVLLRLIERPDADVPAQFTIEPEMIIRESTSRCADALSARTNHKRKRL